MLGVSDALGPGPRRLPGVVGLPRQEQREPAIVMRGLADRFAGRVSAGAWISGAAASGRWEQAVDESLTALKVRAEAITSVERDELRMVLGAVNRPVDRLESLPLRH